MNECTVFELNEQIKKLAIQTRLSTSLKLMDSIVAASAQWMNLPLLTGDDKFKSVKLVDVILLPAR
ncbi:PIN domain-containing protein [Emticicia aquatilis]|uniref:PIN domain-containing protein n=1 Tax=Emticicia aquatilis TaxID=1537369 RepID=UPI0035B5B142